MATRSVSPLLVIAALAASATSPAAAEPGAVSGRVTAAEAPLAAARVYAYQLAEQGMTRVETLENGSFRFEALPAGLYKIIAFKPGFTPAVALLTRASAQAAQFIEMELDRAGERAAANVDDYWSVRRRIPGDVLREIDMAEAVAAWADEPAPAAAHPAALRAQMQAVTGVDRTLDADGRQLTGGRIDVETAIRDVRIGVQGDYLAMAPSSPRANGEGRASWLSLDVGDGEQHEVRLTSVDNHLVPGRTLREPIDLQSHRVSWRMADDERVTRLAAQYTEESNYYNQGGLGSLAAPDASRSWRLEGSYASGLTERSQLEAGFRYRERNGQIASSGLLLPEERIEVFGRAGSRVNPALLVEYGVYSTLRDGTVSLMPRGGFVVRLGSQWRASTTAAVKAHQDALGVDAGLDGGDLDGIAAFSVVQYDDYRSCDHAAEHCYEARLSRVRDDRETLSVGALHRKFDETLRLHFDDSFFAQYEHLVLVPGDSVPELQFALSSRITSGISTRLQSTFGAGGGGEVLLGPRRNRAYSNDVRYLVTSLDTRFHGTRTGMFLAFQHLEQTLQPTGNRAARELTELQKLQLMLTQELGVLHRLASDFAVQLNMEVSRGDASNSTMTVADDPDRLRSRVTGGFAVSF